MTDYVSAHPGHLEMFVGRGDDYLRWLRTLDERLAALASGADHLGFVPPGRSARDHLDELRERVAACNRFVHDVRTALIAAATRDLSEGTTLHQAVTGGGLPPPDDRIRDGVAAAMLAGQTPDRAGIDARYFPPRYVAAIDRLGHSTPVEPAPPRPGSPRHPDIVGVTVARSTGNRTDHALREQFRAEFGLLGTRADRSDRGGTGDDARDRLDHDRLRVIDAVGAHLGRAWQGDALARWYLDGAGQPAGVATTEGSTPFDPPGLDPMSQLGDQLNTSATTGVSFFNRIGPAAAAHLVERPTNEGFDPHQVDASGRPVYRVRPAPPDLIGSFSDALGSASRTGRLTFTGRRLIEEGQNRFGPGLVSLLFTSGDFEAGFLASATIAQLAGNNTGNTDLLEVMGGDDRDRFGTSATNILLTRAAGSAEASAAVIAALGVDGMAEVVGPGAGHRVDDRTGTFPIATFLDRAGVDPDTAATILMAADRSGELGGPGVAAGVDAVMGHHATVVHEERLLAERGVRPGPERLGRADWHRLGLGSDDWWAIRRRVLAHGQGSALAAGHNRLIEEAVAHDLADGDLGDVDYFELAVTSGALDEQWFQRVIEIREQDDARGERNNNYLAAAVSVGAGLASLTALPATGIGATAGFLLGMSTTGLLAVDPVQAWETGSTATELKARLAVQREADDLWRTMVIHRVVGGRAEAGEPVRTASGRSLSLERHRAGPVIVATDPTTGHRTVDPDIDWRPDGRVGDPANDTAGEIHQHYQLGQHLVATGTGTTATTDAGLPIPLHQLLGEN